MKSESIKADVFPIRPGELFAVTLFEEDLAAAKDFYTEIFGLPVVFEDAHSCVFKIGGVLINLLKVSQADELVRPARVASPESGSRLVFTVHVKDVDALCALLTAHGVKLINGPMDRPWGIRTASFADPGGHIWEIAQS
jgi:catechol 2,3-dioxygenase-like lactoylglutathione lyase family enzyme